MIKSIIKFFKDLYETKVAIEKARVEVLTGTNHIPERNNNEQ